MTVDLEISAAAFSKWKSDKLHFDSASENFRNRKIVPQFSLSDADPLSPQPFTVSADDLKFWAADFFVSRFRPPGVEAVEYLKNACETEERAIAAEAKEALDAMQKRQSDEMDLVVAQQGLRKDAAQTRADVAALAGHHVWETDDLEIFWRSKTQKCREEHRKLYRSLICDIASRRNFQVTQPEVKDSQLCDPSRDFIVALKSRLLAVRVTCGDPFAKNLEISSGPSAVVRVTDGSFKSVADRKFLETCDIVSELSWPEVGIQIKNVHETSEKHGFQLKSGDWLTTRHSNLENNILLVFHIIRGPGNLSAAMSRVLACADSAGYARIFMQIEMSEISSVFSAIRELGKFGSLKNLEISTLKNVHAVKTEVAKNLVCLHCPE